MSPAENAALDVVTLRRERKGKFVLYDEISVNVSKEWLIDGLLGCGEMSVVYGHPGSGKSVFVEDAALRIAGGLDVHGRAVRQGAVLYVALERKKLVERRAVAFRLAHGITNVPFALVGGVINLTHAEEATALVAVAKEVERVTGFPTALIVIDTLSRALAGGDENSPKDMGGIVKAAGIIGQGTGAHILFVHHMPVESERLRGHGALLGAADTTILVTKGDVRTATVVKANDSDEGETIGFTLESVVVGTDDGGQQTTAPIVVPADRPQRAPRASKWTRGLNLIQEAITSAINDGLAIDHRATSDAPIVRAVSTDDARQYHKQRYVHGGDGDRAEAERKAWQRNIREARNRSLIGSGMKDGKELVWLA